jgi:pimeloyl-ACP methyl ester carboxylesterase
MPFAERDGVRLFYERGGDGPELLFVPGWCCDHTFYAPQFEHFASSCTVTAIDPRGCGQSSRPDDGYDIPTLADDVAWLCEEVGISQPVVVGHSLAGMMVIELAARHPKLPRAIVSDDPGPIHATDEGRQTLTAFVAGMAGPRGEGVRRAWVVDGAGPTASDEVRRKIVDTMCSVPLPIAAAMIRGVAEWNGVGALALCEVPLLVLNPTGRSNEPSRIRPLNPSMHIGATVGAGHFHQLEVPDQVNAMLERFLAIAV